MIIINIMIIIIMIIIMIIMITRQGKNGVSTNRVTAICVFDRGTFWVLPLTYFYLPKSARAYLLPQSVESTFITFAADPLVLTPFVRNQYIYIYIYTCIYIYIYVYISYIYIYIHT